MEILFNRWRGTGLIYKRLTGTMIYSIYLALLFGLVTQSIYVCLFIAVSFLLAESMGFGKWVGALCYPENKTDLQKEYDDLEGCNFPFIHQMANYITHERKNFFKYCNTALFIRGLIWGLCLYLPLVIFQYISILDYIFVSIAYGLGFPFACYLSRLKSLNYKSKFISIKDRWETQEVYYGFIHMICNAYLIFKILG